MMGAMRRIDTIDELRRHLDAERAAGRQVGFVPTMGYLHDGHASLLRRSVSENDCTVLSIFVNPLQFGVGEDLASYPRDLARDLAVAAEAGADVAFCPDGTEMYPSRVRTTVTVADLSGGYEGASRPTHFAGVATVVTKLLSIVGPCRAYFGEKDYQQIAVVRALVADLSLPSVVVACPTVREDDGLARSSRNVYLEPAERAAAAVLYRALREAAAAIEAGERSRQAVQAQLAAVVSREPLVELDYADVVDAETLTPLDPLEGELRLLIAARVGKPRLLDNVGVDLRESPAITAE